ncbi:MAG: oxidoreductase [Chloroflexi bacterium]|nr:oxidoreductase [Chloroflexota bacterium]|tara:strand:+ start:6806 stop:8338 length:1533 start_codon:yes stop_codon:yes gene_type:complete
MNYLVTITVFFPALTAIFLLFLKTRNHIVFASIISSIITFILSLILFLSYDKSLGGIQFIDHIKWIDSFNIKSSYLVGIDGFSAPLVLLTGLLSLVAFMASWRIQSRVKEYFIWILLLQMSVLGVFTSLDLLLFFVFFEFELIPMYMLISIWGSGRKEYSATKFVIFTLAGGAFMLIAILALFSSSSVTNLSMVSIPELGIIGIPELIAGQKLVIPASIIFIFFFIAFAVKLPLWPLHNWLPDAHTDAPTAVSIMLAGVLLKMAGYGLFRINLGFFQETLGFQIFDYSNILAILGTISIIYGAIVTLRQTDLKRLIAYSSISHMGYVLLGFSAMTNSQNFSLYSLNGSAMQMFTHGTITGLSFLTVGLIYDRTHTRDINKLGALTRKMPMIALFFMISGLASLGLPGFSGFVSEIMIFLGTYKIYPVYTIISAFGVVLAAGYILWMTQRALFGDNRLEKDDKTYDFNSLKDASYFDLLPAFIITIPIILIGIWPNIFIDFFDLGIKEIIR